jgi:hypothetical protein
MNEHLIRLRNDILEQLKHELADIVVQLGNHMADYMLARVIDERDQAIRDICGPCGRGIPLVPSNIAQQWLIHERGGQSSQCLATSIRRRWNLYESLGV